ncbi:uracil phosphoribosyltransferase [candidate division WOR-3 bacterium]|nr:uracil phosphoribosyltransferase [candidate division WOR-3 bacterium]
MLIEIQNPLAKSELSAARDIKTGKGGFRSSVWRMTTCLFLEASKDIRTKSRMVITPLEKTRGLSIDQSEIVLTPILRAGMGMVNPILEFLPEVRVYPVGIKRNEKTLKPSTYYNSLPNDLGGKYVFVLDPMLATGGSVISLLSELKKKGTALISIITIICAPEGVGKIERKYPSVKIYTVSLDRELDDHGYILPGLGDAGDRIFG